MNKESMNTHSYGEIYSRFHGCHVFATHGNLMILKFADVPWDTWSMMRIAAAPVVYPNAQQPFLQAVKALYNSNEICSVFCDEDVRTILLGDRHVILPTVYAEAEPTFYLYATPYFVQDPRLVTGFLQGNRPRPAASCIYDYNDTILYLDNQDVPFPGGCYFQKTHAKPYYRICFLSREWTNARDEQHPHVLKLADEWKSRDGVLDIPYLTTETIACPALIHFEPIVAPYLADRQVQSTGIIQKRFSTKRPHLLIQDILNSYFRDLPADRLNFENLGLIIEWPFKIAYEGSNRDTATATSFTTYVALAINGHHPDRVICTHAPYDRYMEYDQVNVTTWTPILYANSFLPTQPHDIQKVVLDHVVIGFVYHHGFYCLTHPLLEGRPHPKPFQNTESLLSVPGRRDDVQVMQTVRWDEPYSLHQVILPGIAKPCWCLYPTERMDSDGHLRLSPLVSAWLKLFQEAHRGPQFNIDVNLVRLAYVLSTHNICYRLVVDNKKNAKFVTDDTLLSIHTRDKVIDFINEARLIDKTEDHRDAGQGGDGGCAIL